jgi:hypothetical protein
MTMTITGAGFTLALAIATASASEESALERCKPGEEIPAEMEFKIRAHVDELLSCFLTEGTRCVSETDNLSKLEQSVLERLLVGSEVSRVECHLPHADQDQYSVELSTRYPMGMWPVFIFRRSESGVFPVFASVAMP